MAPLKVCYLVQILFQFGSNGFLRRTLCPPLVGLLYVLHDTVYIVMYPAAEILALLHMDCVQQISGLVMLPRLVFDLHRRLERHQHPGYL